MLKVLIADDKPVSLNGLKNMIPWAELNAEITGLAKNGKHALELALANHPDVVITDIKMPIMDGLELCKKLHEVMPGTVKIILSAYSDFSYAQTALRYNAVDYILKPINEEKINLIIEKIRFISSISEKKQNFYSKSGSRELSTRIRDIFKNLDREQIIDIIDNYSPDEAVGYDLSREWYSKLINILFETLGNYGVDDANFIVSKAEALKTLSSFKTSIDMKSYLKDLHLYALDYIDLNRNHYYDSTISNIKLYIEQNYNNPDISLDTISKIFKLSASYISNKFSKICNVNIRDYITRLRLEKARELLKDPTIQVNDIASCVGFYDSHYFARVFRKEEALSPSEYRNLVLLKYKN